MNKPFLLFPKSLSAKIFFFLIISMVCIIAVFNIILIDIQKRTYKSSHDAHGATLMRLLVHSVTLPVITERKADISASVSGLLQQDDVLEVVIWNKEGQVLLQETKDPKAPKSITKSALEIEKSFHKLHAKGQQSMEKEDSFILWGPVFLNAHQTTEEYWYFEEENKSSDKEFVGSAAIVLSKKFFDKGMHNILVQTGTSALIVLAIIVLTTFLIIQNVTEPLRELILTIRAREGRNDQPSDLKMLTETYTNMLEDLEQSFQTISELNEGLEEQVNIRTAQLTEANKELHQKQQKLERSNTDLVEALNRLKETQEQLIQKEKLAAIGQLVAGVAHELNNTVNFISGAFPSLQRSLAEMKEVLAGYEAVEEARGTNLLEKKFEEVESTKEKLAYEELLLTIDQLMENIEEGTTRTTRIVRDLKIFSREDAEKIMPIDLHTIIDSTLNYIDKQSLQDITIHRTYGSLPLVHCLPGRIGQVFLNIINNGIQAMDGTGQLTIRTEQRNEQIHVIFSDTGCGIHAEDVANIFDPFFTTKEVGLGTGLGLGISYSIIKQHGGDIKVRSVVGKGSTFEIILPINPRELSQDA
ncbi:MAG: ATP-binding protein [Candidatus Electrothrix aestuarii]|uniref:histidine kinase n=1 Tax=Candidatus Electrothrix aestuarii TaxID=3062594 RepID=A0AAU8LV89_9BACT|nr:ATP-binding protein [Candidatus Electrothrix aestuarii]